MSAKAKKGDRVFSIDEIGIIQSVNRGVAYIKFPSDKGKGSFTPIPVEDLKTSWSLVTAQWYDSRFGVLEARP